MPDKHPRKLAKAHEVFANHLARLAIGRGFAGLYEDVLREPLPYQLKTLIAKLVPPAKSRDVYDGSL